MSDAAGKSGSVFRRSALERLHSPEQLDHALRVVRPQTLALLGLLLFVIAAGLGWSVFGSIATTVRGSGVIVQQEGFLSIAEASGPGVVSKLHVQRNQVVKQGDLIAEIARPELVEQQDNLRRLVMLRREDQARVEATSGQELANRLAGIERQITAQNGRAAGAQQLQAFLRSKLADEEAMLSKNIITRTGVQDTRQRLAQAVLEAADVRVQLADLETQETVARSQREDRMAQARSAVHDVESRLAELQVQTGTVTRVLAPRDGRVVELRAQAGALVQAGSDIAALDSGSGGRELLLFLPPRTARSVMEGMSARITPTMVKREEYGSILGTVSLTSDFPISEEGLRARLQNDTLARSFFQRDGAPYLTHVKLQADPTAPDGLHWTSERGGAVRVDVGMLAEADVVVRRQAPITLAIPLLREYTGLF